MFLSRTNLTTRIAIGLLIAAGVLECAICVAAYSRGLRQAKAATAQANSDAEAALALAEDARKDAAARSETAERENADLHKQVDRAKDKLDEQAEKLADAGKEALRLRVALDAAAKQVADLVQKQKDTDARIKRAEDLLADAQEAERRAVLRANDLKKDREVVAQAPAADAQADRAGKKKHGHKNGANNQVAAKKRRGGVASLPRTTPSFSELDTDQNGRLSFQEYKVGYPDATEDDFKALDTDGDGSLSIEEYKAGHPDPAVVHVTRKRN